MCFAMAYAIHGALTQAWSDGSEAARTGVSRARTVAKARAAAIRKDGGRASRVALGTGVVLGAAAKGAWWVGRGTGRAVWTGGRDGWARGKARGVRTWARHRTAARRRTAARKASRPISGDPSWRHWITGRCPSCDHTPTQAATEQRGCQCRNRDWGCPCARRNTAHPTPGTTDTEPRTEPTALIKPPAGGDGTAASTDPDQPTPTDPIPTDDPAPAPVEAATALEEHPMTVTGEVTSLTGVRRDLDEFTVAADQSMDVVSAARAEAANLRAAAEAMQAGMDANDFDDDSVAAIAALLEQAARWEQAADELGSAAEGTSAAARSALAAVNMWTAAEEAIKARGRNSAGKSINSEMLVAG